jgi:hypothetical protein
MKIITGLGRCGTSILIKYLKEVGFNIGKNINWYNEINAGYELSTFYPLIDDLYVRYIKKGDPINLDDECLGNYWKGYTYRQAFNLFDKDDRQGSIDVVKDPRITWHPDIIESLWEVRKDIYLIICHRNIEDVFNSRQSLPERYNDPKPRKKLSEYQVDFAEFYTRVLKLKVPHKIYFFPDFLIDFEEFYFKLLEDGFVHNVKKGRSVWYEIIDRSKLKWGNIQH